MLSPVHRSICLSVYPSHGRISQKWLKLGLRNFKHTIPLVFCLVSFIHKLITGAPNRAVRQGRGVENKPSEILGSKCIVVTSLTFLGSRNVVSHITIRLGIGHFLLVVLRNQASISNVLTFPPYSVKNVRHWLT